MFMVNIGEYDSPMDPMGYEVKASKKGRVCFVVRSMSVMTSPIKNTVIQRLNLPSFKSPASVNVNTLQQGHVAKPETCLKKT